MGSKTDEGDVVLDWHEQEIIHTLNQVLRELKTKKPDRAGGHCTDKQKCSPVFGCLVHWCALLNVLSLEDGSHLG